MTPIMSQSIYHGSNAILRKHRYEEFSRRSYQERPVLRLQHDRTGGQTDEAAQQVCGQQDRLPGFLGQLSIADTLHCENPLKVADDWIHEFQLEPGDFDITNVNQELCSHIPTPHDMGKVYTRLILQTRLDEEDYAKGIIRVYNDDICETIDNCNCSAYYEPSYYIARSYFAGGF